MIITITKIEQEFTKNGAEYRKITGVTDKGQQTTKSVFNNLEAKWEYLQENATVELKLEQKGQFWNVIDILPVLTPEPTTPIPQEGQIDEPTDEELDKVIAQDKRVVDAISHPIDWRTHDIHKQVALKVSADLVSHGMVKLGELKSTSEMLLRYLDGE